MRIPVSGLTGSPQGLKPVWFWDFWTVRLEPQPFKSTRDGMGLLPCKCLKAQGILGHARAEDKKVGKRTYFGGPCLEGTLRKPTRVSESSPVAGAIQGFNPVKPLDAGRARELQKCAQPATQMLSVHCLYQAARKSAIAICFFARMFTGMVPGDQHGQALQPSLRNMERTFSQGIPAFSYEFLGIKKGGRDGRRLDFYSLVILAI